MKYNGVELILDNFRDVLFDYSVDVQDVVRSSILDGIDISQYIRSCKNDAYKLDQIRLSLKEGLSRVFFKTSGEVLYQVRQMNKRGVNLASIENQLKANLPEVSMGYLVKWVEDGINVSYLDISIIPTSLLETFDYGLRNGFSMLEFNNGKNYHPTYVKLCLQIVKNDKLDDFLLSGDWSIDCLKVLSRYSKLKSDKWDMLINNIDYCILSNRLESLCKLIKVGINIEKLQSKDSSGKYIYSDECLSIVYDSFFCNLDLDEIIKQTTADDMLFVKNRLELSKKRKISGKIMKK